MERKQRVTSRDVASSSSLSPARSLLPRPPRPPLQCKGCAKGSGAVYVPPSPCYGSHRRPLRAPPFAARARWGRAFPPSVRVGSAQTGNTGRRAKVRPPSSPPRPRSLEQDLGVGLPFEPAPDMHGRGRDGQRHNPFPFLPAHARERNAPTPSTPTPFARGEGAGMGRRVGDVARDCTRPLAARPPATSLSPCFACAQGKGTTGRGRGLRGNGARAVPSGHTPPFSAAPRLVRKRGV